MKYEKYSIGKKYFDYRNEIILIGGHNYDNKEVNKTISFFEIMKNEFVKYQNTAQRN